MLLFGIEFLAVFIHLHFIRQGVGHIELNFSPGFFRVTVKFPGSPARRATTVSVFTLMLA
jgi:hypothetical protein